ncbi:DUF3795 domain-containing protein [Methanospirillum hungatei]|uniref:DUF3795 domain-containing protein n=1 Tax=Methanospirillum hungatei TaxID=2203 RepID=UPI0026ED0A4A|nr:DUF3795 domain-containing protein [Methanospirillum hungatei]MCA1916429.1 DUF3795 domain-containing protein [Methanospirillum hungatei]
MTREIPTVCGMYCDECDHFERDCPGCDESDGSVFWTEFADTDVCPVHECCANEKQFAHCGLCDEMPCEKYYRFRDPDVSEEEAAKMLEKQKENLMRRKRAYEEP